MQIQQQVMFILGLKRRPKVPRDRNITDEDLEQLLPLLEQDGNHLNDTDLSSARLYVVKRVHAILPTCKLHVYDSGCG